MVGPGSRVRDVQGGPQQSGYCRAPVWRTERQRSPEQPGPKGSRLEGNAQISSPRKNEVHNRLTQAGVILRRRHREGFDERK